MKTNKETMNVIAEGMEQAETCCMIDNIAEKAAEAYEEAMEFDIDDIADDLIRDLMAKAYMHQSYKEAIETLVLVFRINEMNAAEEMVMLIVGSCGSDGAYKQFLDRFFRLIAVPEQYMS